MLARSLRRYITIGVCCSPEIRSASKTVIDLETVRPLDGKAEGNHYAAAACAACKTEQQSNQDDLPIGATPGGGLLVHCKKSGFYFADILKAASNLPGALKIPDTAARYEMEHQRQAQIERRASPIVNGHKHKSPAMFDQIAGSTSERAPHCRPAVHATRDCGVGFVVIPRCATGLDRGIAPLARHFFVRVGDNTDFALGRSQYDRTALKKRIGVVDWIVFVSCAPPPVAHASIALLAAAGHNGLVIETRPEQEIDWVNLLQVVRRELPIVPCGVKVPRQ